MLLAAPSIVRVGGGGGGGRFGAEMPADNPAGEDEIVLGGGGGRFGAEMPADNPAGQDEIVLGGGGGGVLRDGVRGGTAP